MRLIECLHNYRFPDDPASIAPVKDGHDHAVDALRYMLIVYDGDRVARVSDYF